MGEKQDKLVVKLATIAIPIPAYVRVNETGNIENVDAHIRHIDIARRGLPSASTKAAKLDPSSKTVSTAKVKAALMKTNPELDEKQLKVSWVSNWRRVTTRTGIKYRERIVKVEHPGYRSVNLRVQQEHTGFSLGGEVPSLPDAGTNRFQKVTDQRVDGPAYTIPFKNEKPVNVQGERWLQGKTTPNKKFYRDYPFEGTAPLLTQTLAKKHGVTVESLNAQAKLDYEYGNGRDTYGIPSPELDAWRKQNAIPIVHEPSNEQLQLPGTGANAPSKPMTWYKDSDRGPAGPGVTPLREADVDLPVDPEFHRAVSAELAKRRKQEDEKAQRVSAMLNIFEAEDNNWGVGHPISKAHRAMSDEDLMNEMDGITQSIASLEDRLRGSYYDGEPTIEEARWLVQISNLHAEYNVLADELASRHPDRDAELMNIEVGGNFAPKKPESVKAALWKLLNLRYIDVESGKPVYVEGASRAPILPGLGTSAPKKGAKSDPSVAKALVAKFAPTGQPTDPDIPPYTIGTFKGVKRPSDAVVDVKDERVVKGAGLTLDTDVLDAVMQIVGVNVDEKTKIHIRIIDAHPGETDAEGHQHAQDFGVTQQVGPNEYIVSVRVLSKDNFSDNSLYVINNSLLHEMRHVTQMQHKPGHGADYQKQNATVGYGQNKYELDSRLFGRLADHKGVKDAGDLGPAIGNGLNAFTQSDKYHDGVEPSQAPTGGGLPTINAPEADPEVEQAKLDGTADGEKEVESLIPMTPEERIKTVAQAKINGIKLYNESQAEQDKAKFAQSEYMRRRYKVLRTALKDGEKEKVDALVAESGVDVPEKPSASGGDMLGQVLQILMGGGGPAPVDEEVEAAKVAGDALGAEKIPSLQAMDSDARVKAVADVKIAGIKAAIEAQAKQDHAKFVESESLRRQYKTIRTTLQGDEKEKMDALVEASGLKVPTASKVGGGGAGPDLQALLGGGAPQIDPEVEEAKAKGTIEGEAELPSLQAMEPDERVAEIGQVKIDGLKMATEADTEQDYAKFVQSELFRRKYKAMKEALLEGEKEQMDAWVSKTLSKVPGADEPEDGGLLEIAPNAPKTSRAVASSPWSIAKRSLRQKSAQWEAETWEPQFFGKSSGLTFAQWISNRMDNDGDVNLPDFGAGHFIGRNSGAYAVGHRGVTDTSAGAMKAFALNLMKANPGISIQQVAAAWMDKEVDSEWTKSDSYDSMFWSLVDYLGKLEIQR